jgi:nucleoside-diphosphate-sugar epimerase
MIRKLIPQAKIEIGPGHWHLDRQGPWSIAAAETELGFRPEMPLERGIAEYAVWLEKHDD